ncbi:hypothetical protein AMATHDRAFT_73588 [Amanita thiersii Skay4041]|uniref:RING-type E3 ubiquitin transferase n=1 Tax=Amanita thiersii Skay4041 TaxID=703135 RepID=A0A2A9NZC3_9AGAR|nr:hypothetical protein AMATHDRAFT_73588 [Amanita thiersii Skay4041]
MLSALLRAILIFILSFPVNSYPAEPSPPLSFTAKSERSWLWGWAWGAESTVSVVDHTPVVSFPSRPAAFGADISEPILGYVIPVSAFSAPCEMTSTSTLYPVRNNGCPPLCLTAPNYPTETWIALVQRGQCEFVKKVREAQRMGAKAVVVGGEDPAISGYPDTLVNMFSPEDSSDIKIAATYIKYTDYVQLWQLIESSNTSHSGMRTLSLLITAEYSAWEWYSPIITFIVILLLPSALTFLTLLIHRIRAARAAQRDRAPEDIVHNLPWRVWTGHGWEKHEGSGPDSTSTTKSPTDEVGSTSSTEEPMALHPWFENQVECAICLSEFVKGDKVRILPCHHIFHMEEVDSWLIQRKKLCPVCKADVTKPQQQASDQSSHDNQSILSSPNEPTERTPLLGHGQGQQPQP